MIKNGERPGPARRLLTRATLGVLALYALGIGCDSDSNPLIPTPEELGPKAADPATMTRLVDQVKEAFADRATGPR